METWSWNQRTKLIRLEKAKNRAQVKDEGVEEYNQPIRYQCDEYSIKPPQAWPTAGHFTSCLALAPINQVSVGSRKSSKTARGTNLTHRLHFCGI